MEMTVHVEKPSPILRKLTIKVPAGTVQTRLEKGWVSVQKTAKIKGFRPGNVPIAIVKQHYGEDVQHQVFHDLVDESFKRAVVEQNLKTVGSPKIEVPNAEKKGEGEHADHSLREGEDLTYTATIEIFPEVDAKGYTGLTLTKQAVEVTDEDVEKVIKGILDSKSELIPATGGLILADGGASSRSVRKGDFVDVTFEGKVKTETGFEARDDMKGNRVVEIGSDSLIPGFEEQLIDLRAGESKTFQIPFPKDFHEPAIAGKDAEFSVTVNEVKEKKTPELNDEFVKQNGYESVLDLRTKIRDHLLEERTHESERKLQSDILKALIEKNDFEVPNALIRAQTQTLMEDMVNHLKQQKFDEALIKQTVGKELGNLMKRAETQVRATLILQSVSQKEGITVNPEEVEAEIARFAVAMQLEESRMREFYEKNPDRREGLEFKMLEDKTVKFLIEKSKINSQT